MIVNEFNLKKDQRLHLCQMFINDVVTQETDPDKYDRLQEILIALLEEDRFVGEVKKLVYGLIVQNFSQRLDLQAESIQVSRNVIDLFVEVLKRYQK